MGPGGAHPLDAVGEGPDDDPCVQAGGPRPAEARKAVESPCEYLDPPRRGLGTDGGPAGRARHLLAGPVVPVDHNLRVGRVQLALGRIPGCGKRDETIEYRPG